MGCIWYQDGVGRLWDVPVETYWARLGGMFGIVSIIYGILPYEEYKEINKRIGWLFYYNG